MRKYMMEKVAAGTHRSMVKMEVAPGFYAMDSGGFVSVVCRTELGENMQRRSRVFSGVTIRKCLWHTALPGERLRRALPPVLRRG